jgi:hypothetical protein
MAYHVINADARATGLPDAFFHCVATSPPYFGLREYGDDDREIGDEKTPAEYVTEIVKVGREVRRVMRDDGVWWLNLGDSFGPGKSLLMIPQRVALALQDDGWIVRAHIPWFKASCMPESVRDRPTVAHEYVFQLVKQPRYFWDPDAVRVGSDVHVRKGVPHKLTQMEGYKGLAGGTLKRDPNEPYGFARDIVTVGRNIRTSDFFNAGLDEYEAHIAHVRENGGMMLSPEGDPLAFLVNPVGSKLAHFAMWPPKLVKPMILSSTSEKGCCPQCGAQLARVVEKTGEVVSSYAGGHIMKGSMARSRNRTRADLSVREPDGWGHLPKNVLRDRGFSPSCECNAGDPVPCRVLDPFAGSGTTMQVCEALGRDSWGVELMAKNLPIIAERMKETLDPQTMKPTKKYLVKGRETKHKSLTDLHAEYMAKLLPMAAE